MKALVAFSLVAIIGFTLILISGIFRSESMIFTGFLMAMIGVLGASAALVVLAVLSQGYDSREW